MAIPKDFIMPYGKFKGREMTEIPSGYLKWLAENCEDEAICCATDEEYQWREANYEHFWED